MNYHAATFIRKAADDVRLLPTHLSLMMAIFYLRDDDTPQASVTVSRSKLMHFSRIRSIATYHKCLKDLVTYGYVHYHPTYHPTKASRIRLLNEKSGPAKHGKQGILESVKHPP